MYSHLRLQKTSSTKFVVPKPIRLLFFVAFIYASMTSFISYGNSTFLSEIRGIPESLIGIIFILGSCAMFFMVLNMPALFERLGNKRILVSLSCFSALVLFALAFIPNTWITIALFISHLVLVGMLLFAIDINIEHYTDASHEATERGLFLTSMNISWLIFPFAGAQILGLGVPHHLVYVIAGGMMLLCALFSAVWVPSYVTNVTHHSPFFKRIKDFLSFPQFRRVFLAGFSLQFFFAIMVIYVPLYLVGYIGIPWEKMGFLFTIMLLPFVLLEAPLGRLADRRFGQREMMLIGMTIIALVTASLSFLTTPTWWVWAIVLFTSRVGASMLEVMSESHFYKIIDANRRLDFASIFKESAPLAYMSATVFSTLLLGGIGLPLQYLFLFVGIVLLAMIPFVAPLKDTR